MPPKGSRKNIKEYETLRFLNSLDPDDIYSRLLRRRFLLCKLKRTKKMPFLDLDKAISKGKGDGKRVALVNYLACPTNLIPLHFKTINLIMDTRAKYDCIKRITDTKYENSFASRIFGNVPQLSRTSTWTGKHLHPYIWRNRNSACPPRLALMNDILRHGGSKCMPNHLKPACSSFVNKCVETPTVDYVFFERKHLDQVNLLLCDQFWDGINVKEALQWPGMCAI